MPIANPLPAAPVAARRPHVEVRFGASVEDPYYWLRERDNPDVRAYLEAENAYTAALTGPVRELEQTIYDEILGRIQQTDLTVPVKRGEFFYYSRTVEGLQYPIHCRKKGESGHEQILLDVNQLAEGLEFFSLGNFEISDDARLLAYTDDRTGMRQYTLHVLDLDSGALLDATAERVTSVEWSTDNRTLLFTTEDATTKRSDRLFHMELGSPAVEVYHEPDELYHIGVQRTRDRAYLLLGIAATDSTEFHYWPADQPTAPPRLFLARAKDHKYDLNHRDGLFYVRTNQGAKNFKVVTLPAAAPDWSRATEFMPHHHDVLIEDLDLFRDFGVVHEKFEALNRLRVYNFATAAWTSIPFPEPVYAAFGGGNPENDTTRYRYSYQSLVTPPSVFEFDMSAHTTHLLKQQPVLGGYDLAQYESARLWVTARDGARVPLSVVYKKLGARPERAPLLLYGYGAYGYGLPAGFSVARLSLLDRGVTYVMAHVRGGNELGEPWHDAGMLMHKMNTFTDFIDCAEHLIAERWTTSKRLAVEGGSAGGLLIGAVLNLRPDLFRAAHLAVPFVDVMNTMLDPNLPLTVGEYLEWGDPRQPAAYEYMRSYSPYDNLTRRAYPAILVTTSLNDSQVMYWEPVKYVAKLRTLKTNDTQLLLKTNLGAGHGGASGRYDRIHETAFEFAWLVSQIVAD
ncbi:MAG TPA: S9 family peptidase [Terriglobales bacterium]|nr:S9 family peptidase [Terriglobales bacterium]